MISASAGGGIAVGMGVTMIVLSDLCLVCFMFCIGALETSHQRGLCGADGASTTAEHFDVCFQG